MTAPALLVTGPTGALGEAVVQALAGRGDRLLLAARDEERLAVLDKEYGSPGIVETLPADVSDPVQARAAAAEAVRRLGGLTGMVHLVGGFDAGPVVFTAQERYEELLRANFLTAVTATQAVLPYLPAGGHLVYFSTPLADEPLPALSAYAAAKAALIAWMRSMAHEVKRQGVHANAVVLTVADTPEKRAERPDFDFDQTVTPAAVAKVVEFLTGPAAEGLYGACVPVLGRFEFSSALAGPPPGLAPRGAAR